MHASFNNRIALFLAATLCCGCNQFSQLQTSALHPAEGRVMGGEQPISTATIQLYAVGTAGDGSPAAPLLTSTVITGTGGVFTLTGLFKCPTPTSLVYLLASGGNPGLGAGTNNTAIELIAALGQCQTLGSSTFITVNEVTTVAALSALSPYFATPTSIGSDTSDAAALSAAFTLASQFANASSGTSPGSGVPSGFAVPTQQINTLADIIVSCVNSGGGTAGDGSSCGNLFNSAKSGLTAPQDVATALVNILNNPLANVGSLFNLASSLAPFQPTIGTTPSNWSVALTPTFTVTYAANGATSGSVPVDGSIYFSGSTAVTLANTGSLLNPGLSFAGWNTAANGSGAAYAAGATIPLSSNITLFAQWADWPIAVWGGAQEAIALKSDGTVWTWGYNNWGELGNNSINNSSVPIQVLGPDGTGHLTGIKAIMGGETHNVALKSDGTVWAWGWNSLNQLGNGNSTDSWVPTQVSGLTNIVSLGSRAYHTLAIKSDGTVWAWGYDKEGALGNGLNDTASDNPVPILVQGVNNPIMVSAGYCFSVALMQDHTLMAWGKNNGGQLGNGTTADSYSPIAVPGISNVAWVSAGWGQVLAVKTDGTVWAWGSNTWGGTYPGVGLLGNGTTANSSVPVQITSLSGAVMASGGDSMSVVLLNDGTVWAFGSNGAGQLGNGSNVAQSLVPVQVQGLTNIVFITARDHHAQAIRSDGTVWSWGDGLVGELGDGQTVNSSVPVKVTPF